ncbi:hypothetical protein U9M48_040734 [Paspalum notatum var. saurae]|uniref:Uncharacterized protein n=1 Tax=Paspalum notatum var. saurae TaxID=547442 RepID=A0AAQ3UME8_PASNO
MYIHLSTGVGATGPFFASARPGDRHPSPGPGTTGPIAAGSAGSAISAGSAGCCVAKKTPHSQVKGRGRRWRGKGEGWCSGEALLESGCRYGTNIVVIKEYVRLQSYQFAMDHPEDAKYINTYIHSFWPMCHLFARGVLPDWRRQRNRRRGIRDERGEVLRGASSVGEGGGNVTFLDDDDDDFMPMHGQATTQSARGVGTRSTSRRADSISPQLLVRYLAEHDADSLSMRGQVGRQEVGPGPRRSTSRPAAASSSRRSNVNFVDDDDDDFIPMRGQAGRREK